MRAKPSIHVRRTFHAQSAFHSSSSIFSIINEMVRCAHHIVEDVQQIGDTVAILHERKVLIHENKENLTQQMAGEIGVITIRPEELPSLEERVKVLQVHTEEDGSAVTSKETHCLWKLCLQVSAWKTCI